MRAVMPLAIATVLTGLLAWAALRLLVRTRRVLEHGGAEHVPGPSGGPDPPGS